MTNEANAAIAGALEAGAKAVLVNDSHWLRCNLLAEELNPHEDQQASAAIRTVSPQVCERRMNISPSSRIFVY